MQELDSRSKELDELASQSDYDRRNLQQEKEKVCDGLLAYCQSAFFSYQEILKFCFLFLFLVAGIMLIISALLHNSIPFVVRSIPFYCFTSPTFVFRLHLYIVYRQGNQGKMQGSCTCLLCVFFEKQRMGRIPPPISYKKADKTIHVCSYS